MRAFCGLVPVLLLLSVSAAGQRVLVGLKGGGNLSSAVGADAVNSRLRLGGHAGLLTRFQLPALGPVRGLALQAEALYALRGDRGTDYGFTLGHRLDYLDVPALLQYQGRDGLFIETGAQYSLLLRATPNLPPPPGRLGELTLRKRELSLVVGLGYQDSTGMSVGWRYVAGLDNVFYPGEISGSGQRHCATERWSCTSTGCLSRGSWPTSPWGPAGAWRGGQWRRGGWPAKLHGPYTEPAVSCSTPVPQSC